MRTLLASAVLLLAAACVSATSERYVWMPDIEGNVHLVDLLETDPNAKAVNGPKDVTLHLYTQKNRLISQTIKLGDSSSSSNFNPAHPTRFVIHGWTANYLTMRSFATAYLNTGRDYNVVLVDYSGPASSTYATSIKNSQQVAEYLKEVINDMVDRRGLNLNDVYVIGHSLGGQMAGVLGNRLNGQVAQIIGLDPAGPSFYTMPLVNRLDPTDGKLVQVIHTNGGTLGYSASAGHIDFYPAGGSKQPGCTIAVDVSGFCSHLRVLYLFTESITNNQFVATRCDSYTKYNLGRCKGNAKDVLGEYTAGSVQGDFYLSTNRRSPYAKGD